MGVNRFQNFVVQGTPNFSTLCCPFQIFIVKGQFRYQPKLLATKSQLMHFQMAAR